MIDMDISHIWNGISLPELLEMEREIFAAHEKLAEKMADAPAPELERIVTAAETIRNTSSVCVIVAAADLTAGVQAAMELLPCPENRPEILFAGDTLSTRQRNRLTAKLEGKDFSLIAISRTGTTLESAIAFRDLRWMMERRFGTEEAERRIYAVTEENSPLWQLAQEHRWHTFSLPADARFEALSPAGLLPMAVAGLDVAKILHGAANAPELYNLRSFENPLWLYTGVRSALYKKGYGMEVFGGFDMGFRQLGMWWQQLFSGMEGKFRKGPFPVPAEYPQDLHTLGHRLTAGERGVFETMLYFDTPDTPYTVGSDVNDLEGLNDLAGKTLEEVRYQAFLDTVSAHDDSGIPVMTMDLGQLDAEKLGELFAFFTLACGISAHMLGFNPDSCDDESAASD